MSQSTRLGLPFIEAGQIDKSMTHNEALALLDIAVGAAVDGLFVETPPTNPDLGACYIVGNAPAGAWAGHARALAGYTAGGWRFVEAKDGMRVLDKASGETVVFNGGAWEKGQLRAAKVLVGGEQVVGARLAAVSDPSAGTIIDAEARAAIASILARLRAHGLIAS